MSRIGKKPIPLHEGVTCSAKNGTVEVKGKLGQLSEVISPDMKITVSGDAVTVERPTDRKDHRALHGLTRSLIANMVDGVTDGYSKTLEIQGVGYRAHAKGKGLELSLGYSHPVIIDPQDGIDFEVPIPTRIIIKGISKQKVGQVAADIRKKRPPEPYKGKGIRYEGEHVARKVGKRT